MYVSHYPGCFKLDIRMSARGREGGREGGKERGRKGGRERHERMDDRYTKRLKFSNLLRQLYTYIYT